MTDTYYALLGLLGGFAIGLSCLYFGNTLSKKKRGLDERHHMIRMKAKSSSWIVTLVTVYILYFAAILQVSISIVFILGTLMLVQIGSWFCFVFYYRTKY